MKQHFQKKWAVLLCLISIMLLCLGVAACGETKTYTVTVSETTNGTITLSPEAEGNKYEENAKVEVTVTPAQGYEVDTFTVSTDKDAALTEGKYTLTVTADTTISATFKQTSEEPPAKTTYTVTVSETSNGTITLDPEAEGNKYEENAQVEVTVTPSTGYVVDTFTVSTDADAELDGEGKYTLTVTANTTISATFKTEPVAEKYGVTKNAPENGEIEITPAADAEGKYAKDTEITVTLKPAQGYEVATFTVGGVNKKAELENNVYKFNITAETEINATFKKSVPAVTAITLNKSSLELMWNYFKEEEEKSVFTLSIASVTPSEISADELEIEWEVDDDTYAEVDASGKITAKTTGATYVTATVKGTDVTAMCTISVTKHEHTLTYAKKDDSQHTATCSVCEYTYDEVHSTHLVSDGESGHHTACEAEGCDYKTETVQHGELVLSGTGEGVDNAFHTMRCPDGCGYYVQKQHKWVVQTSATEHWNQCSVCQRESNHTDHKLAYRLSEDGTKHIAYCTDSAVGATSNKCTYVGEEEEHAGSECEVKTEDPTHHYTKCEKCKALFGATAHSGTEYAQKDGDADHHYTKCAACETLYNATEHSGTEYAQKDGDADHHYTKCAVCKTLYNQASHILSYTDKDDDVHSVECSVCKKTFADEPHEIDGAACKCGHQVGSHTVVVDEHGYTDGSCSCGQENLFFTTDGTGTITGFKADAQHTKIRIPTQIGQEVITTFKSTGVFVNNTDITDIIVPASVLLPSSQAFSGCSNLKSAVILSYYAKGETKSIPMATFQCCENLESIVVSAEITNFSAQAFGTDTKNVNGFKNSLTIYYLGTVDLVKTNGNEKSYIKANAFLQAATILKYNESGKTGDDGWHWEVDRVIPKPWKEE